MEPKIITNKAQYEKSLSEIDSIMMTNPKPGSAVFDRLQVLAVLIEKYEKEQFKFESPDPIEAIQFRMEEQGLKQVDLIPYIGSKSKVSEILSGKRPLTIQMIRALSEGLAIPAEVLLGSVEKESVNEIPTLNYSKFPIKEMRKRGWISESVENVDKVIQAFIQPLLAAEATPVLWRRTQEDQEQEEKKYYSLLAWSAYVLSRANLVAEFEHYEEKKITKDFLRDVAKLSVFENGPLLACELLKKNGVIVIFEPHLPTTKIDGATFTNKNGNPVIVLTLRYDRLDYFWFTLMHELVHVMKHLKGSNKIFIDDFEDGDDESTFEIKEKEADFFAKEAFIPRNIWARSEAMKFRTEDAALKMAKELGINPAIVAGRIRRETKNYAILNDLLGEGKLKSILKGKW